ncbi:DUF1430 domain-containing protein [Bacillus tropicus]
MKKILFSLYIVISLLSFFVFVDLISTDQEKLMKQAGKETSFVFTMNPKVLDIEEEKFLSILYDASNRYNANIYKPFYSDESSVEYVYLTHNVNSYFSNFILLNGYFPKDTKIDDFNLSTSENKLTTGKLFSYKKEVNFTIKPLKELFKDNKPSSGKYIVSLKNKNHIEPFIDVIERKLGITIEYTDYQVQSPIGLFWLKIVPIIILFVLSVLTTIYYYFLEYKNSAIRLLNGYGAFDIWKKYFYEVFILYFLAVFSSTVVMVTIKAGDLIFTSYWLKVIITYFQYQLIAGIILCFVMSYPFIRVKKISISSSIKNMKPLKQIQFINFFTKTIFSIIILYLLFVSCISLSDLYRYSQVNMNQWEKIKEYGIMPTRALGPNGNNPRAVLELFDKQYKLFKYTNDRGAILIKVSDDYKAKQHGVSVAGSSIYSENTIMINNNYLKLNGIKTIDNKLVEIDENSEELTVLVPEKYKSKEKELKQYLDDTYYFQKYEVKNSFLKAIGEKQTLKENKQIHIVWVKNNQYYFTFSTENAKDTNNRIYDGIGIVLTNKNGNEGAWYDTAVGSDGYFIKLTDKKVPYNSIKNIVNELGLQNFYPVLYNAYDLTDTYIQENLKVMYKYIFALLIILVVYLLVSFFTTMNYLEQYKFKHTVQTINGYSYFDKHKLYLIFTNAIWLLIIICSLIIENYLFGFFTFILFVLENIITYLVLKQNEGKKMLRIIKEG